MSKQTDDIEKEVASRLGIEHEQVRLVMLDFFHHLLKVLQNPSQYFYKGVLIAECFKIKVNPAVVMRTYFGKINRNCPFTRNMDKDFLTFYNLLKKYDQYSQRQKEAIIRFDEGCNNDTQSIEVTSG